MGYSEVDQVRLVLSSINAEQGGTAADLSDEQIQYEIDSASAVIDSALRIIYKTPFTPDTPFIITSICTDMAAYGCDLNYRKSREYDSQNMPIILRYNKANNTLSQIVSGTLTIDWPRVDISTGTIVVHQYPYPLFDFCDVFGYRPQW